MTGQEKNNFKQLREELFIKDIDAYLQFIKQKTLEVSPKLRIKLMSNLENFAKSIEEMKFDPDIAREIRKKYGRTTEVSKMIGISQAILSHYEIGRFIPSLDNPKARKYLEFLKEKGYDPFNL